MLLKIVKNAILLSLSLLFVFVSVSIAQVAQAKQNQSREISFKPVKASQNNLDIASKKDFAEQAGSGTNTASLVVSHGAVSYSPFSDHNMNDHYRKTTAWFDVDSNKAGVKYYAVFYIDDHDGYGWYTTDNLKSDMYTIDGYSPDDGIYLTSIYWMGSKEDEESVKIEVYYEDGTLACSYGPDDNQGLGNIKIESIEYDVKENPFTSNPTPNPTPTPDDVAKITGYIVDKDGDNIGNAKIVARKEGETIATVSSDENGEFVLENLGPGEYDLTVTKKGYRRRVVTVPVEEDGDDEKIVIQMKKQKH